MTGNHPTKSMSLYISKTDVFQEEKNISTILASF